MSDKGSSFVAFLAGALVGAAIALLYAPSSGEELRTQIKTEADTRMEKLSAEMEKRMAELQATAEKTRADVMSYLEQFQEMGEEVSVEVDLEGEQE